MAHSSSYQIPALQAAFRNWLGRERDSIPLILIPIETIHGVHVTIYGIPSDNFLIWIRPTGLDAVAEWKGRVIDFLYGATVTVRAYGNVYGCAECQREKGETPFFETKDALWEHHLFEPLGKWLREVLAPAAYLSMWIGPGGTSAYPEKVATDTANVVIPLDHAFYAKLRDDARHAETADVVYLGGLTIDQIALVQNAGDGDDTIGSYDVTGLDSDAFIASLTTPKGRVFTDAEVEEGKRLLAACRRPREA